MPEFINNRYLIVRKLGKGGMGTVYLVEDTLRDNQVLALKMIRADLLGERSLAQFKYEFAALAQLRHPNLVAVYDFGISVDNESYFFTMEYVLGEPWPTLAARLLEEREDYLWLYEQIVQVCRALQCIHSRGFIHYDVKPHHVIITPEGEVKLMDFGLIGRPRGEGLLRVRGTPEYVAPELVRGDSVDHRADLYSLGVSLYEIVTGRIPFQDTSSTQVLQKHLETELTLPDEVAARLPEALRTIVERLLAKEPVNRYGSANEIIRVINELVGSDFPVETRETRRSYIQSGIFVGHEFELARLQGLLMRAMQGQGRMALIAGPTGVGKTRLVREVRLRAQMQRMVVCEGACEEHARTPYRPWLSILRQLISYLQTIDPGYLQRYSAPLVHLMPELSEVLGRQPIQEDVDKADLLEAVADFLLSCNHPLLLVIEDLHYADAETLELLAYVGQRAARSRLLLLGAFCDEEISSSHPLNALIRNARLITRHDPYSRPSTPGPEQDYELLRLDLLDEEATADLVRSMLGVGQAGDLTTLPEGLISWLMTETGGNPLFIESLMHNLVEEDLLRYDGEAWSFDASSFSTILVSIQEAAQRRLQRLDERTLEMLQWGSVMGLWLDLDLLSDVSGLSPDVLFVGIVGALRQHVLIAGERAGEPAYRFSDDQMRQAIYNTLSPEERVERHANIGEVLLQRFPEAEVAELLTWHFEQAGRPECALHYARLAGDKARRLHANETAIRYYSQALTFARADGVDVEPEMLYEILSGREDAYRIVGDLPARQADLEEMARIAAELGETSRQIDVMSRQVKLVTMVGNSTEFKGVVEEALALARQAGNVKLQADSLSSLGDIYFALGDQESAWDCHQEALGLYRELGDPKEAYSLYRMGAAYLLRGEISEAERCMHASLELYRQQGNQIGEADTYNILGIATRDYARKRDYYEQSLAMVEAVGDRDRMSRVHNNLALVYWELGLYGRARDYLEQAVYIQREMQGRARLAFFLESLSRVYLELGEYNEAHKILEEGLALAVDVGDRMTESLYWFGLGRLKLARDSAHDALELLDRAVTLQQELGLTGYLFSSLSWKGLVYLRLGDWQAAEQATAESMQFLLQARDAAEFPPQDVWWNRYRVLNAAKHHGEEIPEEDVWQALQQAHTEMMNSIANLSDEGLRRNFLNKVQINRDIITAWTRELAQRNQGAALEKSAVALDVERGKGESEQLKERLRRVLDISVRMNETHDAESLLNYVMDQVIELSGAERGFLVLLDEAGQFDFRVAVGMDRRALELGKAQISYTVLGSVAQSRIPVLLQDALTDERFGAQSSVLELSLRSVLCVPLVSGSELIGMIYADNRSVSGRFLQSDLDLMMIFSNQVATALENAQLYESLIGANKELEAWARTLEERVNERTAALQQANVALSRRAVQLETSHRVGQQVTSILELDALLSEVAALIRSQFGYYFVGVWLLDEAAESAVLRAGTGAAPQRLLDRNFKIPVDAKSVIADVCQSGKQRLVKRVEETLDFLWVEELPGIAAELVLPLQVGETLFGVLDIASNRVDPFDEDDLMVLQSSADQVAIAIRNAQLYESEQHRRRLAEALEHTGRELSRSLSLSEVPLHILELLNTLVPYQRGLVLLKQEEQLVVVAHHGFPDHERVGNMNLSIREGDVFRQLQKRRRPLLVEDVTREPGWQQVSWLPLNRSWMGVPLISKDEVIGMISLTRREAGAFSPEDTTWIQAFAAQAVVALENARLYAEITKLNEELEQRVEERTEELNHAYLNLERLDRTKSDFINVAAHELRTPLTVIRGYTQIMKQLVAENPQMSDVFEGIISGTDRLHEIINSMLDVAKIDSESLQIVRTETLVGDLIRRVHVGFMSALQERNMTMNLSEDIKSLPEILGDPDLLYKVFYQLVMNAIKYTPDGGRIDVTGQVLAENGEPSHLEIVFSDTGIGIDPSDHELIFEKFYQTGELEFHSSGRTKFKGGGPGLGLAIVRGIVMAHGGRIWVESEGCDEEHCPGSAFHVLLPLNGG